MKKVLLIGCGHMGNALLDSWINSYKYSLTVIDPVKYKYLKIKYKYKKLKITNSILNLDNDLNFEFIVFAVRPKDLKKVLNELANKKINRNCAFVSVIAGKKINVFRKKLKNNYNFFRVMPNMPASIGQSMNCVVSSKESSKSIKDKVYKLLSYSGKTIFLQNENQIDMATAISGSGPGFIFNLIDALERAAINLGFEKNIARTLVHQTFKGSINLLDKKNVSAEKLVKVVATKGGTTEAGLKVMKSNNIQRIFKNFTKASYKRAKEQGN